MSKFEYAALRQRFFGEDPMTAILHARAVRPASGQTMAEAYDVAARSLLAVDASNAKWIAL